MQCYISLMFKITRLGHFDMKLPYFLTGDVMDSISYIEQMNKILDFNICSANHTLSHASLVTNKMALCDAM